MIRSVAVSESHHFILLYSLIFLVSIHLKLEAKWIILLIICFRYAKLHGVVASHEVIEANLTLFVR